MNQPDHFAWEYAESLLHGGQMEAAGAYCQTHLEGNALAHYGLGLALLRHDPGNLTVAQLQRVIGLLEVATELSPEFADAHFMCGMTYNILLGILLRSLQANPSFVSIERMKDMDVGLARAEACFSAATRLEPAFAGTAKPELQKHQALVALGKELRSRI